jgi:hypothetical protein
MENYLIGSEMIGAAAPDSGGPYVTIHVNNVNDLVASQAGSLGTLASSLLPQTIQAKVYNTIAQQIQDGFKQNGVQADVKVVAGNVPSNDLGSDLVPGILIGAGLVGACYGIVKLIHRHKK